MLVMSIFLHISVIWKYVYSLWQENFAVILLNFYILNFSILHSQPKKCTKLKSSDNYDARKCRV